MKFLISPTFIVISQDNKNIYKKSFFIPRYFNSTWSEAGVLCRNYGLELASLHTVHEYNNVVEMLKLNSTRVTEWTFINGMTLTPKSRTDWYWVDSGRKVSYTMQWWRADQPDFYQNSQWCLALGPMSLNMFQFDDVSCNESPQKFLCQKLEFLVS
jgi:hypothetical protein